MPNLNFKKLNCKKPSVYIETGTYLGNGIKHVLNNYDMIHSIELSNQWYTYNVKQFNMCENVKIHYGDSKFVLPDLLSTINEPVVVYLDAHYSGGTTAFGEEETPLLHELDILKRRQYNDIIVIDDCRLIGKKGVCGISKNDPIYPTMRYDWCDITDTKIQEKIKVGYKRVYNTNREYTDGATDQIILFP